MPKEREKFPAIPNSPLRPSPCPPAVRGLRPRPRGLGRRLLREQALVGAIGLARCAPLARRRAAPCRTTYPPPCIGSRRFRTSGRVFLHPLRRDDRTVYPSSLQSEKRTQRPKLVAIAESPLRCDSARPGSVLLPPRSARRLRRPCRCCYGPLLRSAIRRNLARASAHHLTTSRGPRDEALRNSGAPTVGSEWRFQVGGGWEGAQDSRLFRGLEGTLRLHRGSVEKLSVFSSVSSLCLCGSSGAWPANPKSEIRNHAARVTITTCHMS